MRAAKTVITESVSDAVVEDGRETAALRCSAVTDPLTPLTITWIRGSNASDACATLRTVDERRQQVLVKVDEKHACCALTCSASNGLSEASRSATVCSAKHTNTLSTGYRQGQLQLLHFS